MCVLCGVLGCVSTVLVLEQLAVDLGAAGDQAGWGGRAEVLVHVGKDGEDALSQEPSVKQLRWIAW